MMTAEFWMLLYQRGGLFFWSCSSLWALFMNDLISVYDQMSCKLLCAENQGMLLFPVLLTWNCCACPASSWRTVRLGSEQQQKHTPKTTRSNVKRERQSKQRNLWKIGCASWIGPCTGGSSLPGQHQLEREQDFCVTGAINSPGETKVFPSIFSGALAINMLSSACFY